VLVRRGDLDAGAIKEVLARDLPVLTIHQQAQIGVSSVQLRNQWRAANYQWWHQIWLAQ